MAINTCIFCNDRNTLNTSMTISLDSGEKVTVLVCDTHAEDATVKTAKAAYVAKQKQIEAFLAQAELLGLKVTQTGSGIAVADAAQPAQTVQAVQPQQPQSRPQPRKLPPNVEPVLEAEDDTTAVDKVGDRGMVSVGGDVPGFGRVAAHASHSLQEVRQQIPTEALKGKVKPMQITDRAGRTIVIAGQRRDGLGTTNVRITESGGDQALQRRFKQLAESSRYDQVPTPDFRGEYALRGCPVCQGECTVLNRGEVESCPKCGGSGFIG